MHFAHGFALQPSVKASRPAYLKDQRRTALFDETSSMSYFSYSEDVVLIDVAFACIVSRETAEGGCTDIDQMQWSAAPTTI